MEDKSNWSFNRSSNLFIHCEAVLQVLCCWLLMMVMLLNKISHLEFTFRKSPKKQLTFVHIFILRLNSLTQSQEQSHTYTYILLSHAVSEQPESPRAINISLSASKCIRWSLGEHAFQYLRSVFGSAPAQTLPRCLLTYFAVCCPERLITWLKGAFKGWSILRGCLTVCAHCQVLVGDGQIS